MTKIYLKIHASAKVVETTEEKQKIFHNKNTHFFDFLTLYRARSLPQNSHKPTVLIHKRYLIALAVPASLAEVRVVLVSRSARSSVDADWWLLEAVVSLTNLVVHVTHHLRVEATK